MGRSVKKIFLWNLIFICCQLVVLITAASRRKDINILQMLEDQPPGLDTFKLSPRGWKFTQAFPSLELSSKHIRRFFRRSSKDLTFVFSGIIENRENVTLLGIYEENKTLPYLHVSVNSQHDSLIFRYQGTRSFQRVVIPLYTSSDSFYEIKVSLKFRKLTVMKKCETIWTGQLQQKMSYIPRKVFLKFGQDNSGNSKLNGAVFKAWLLSSSSSSKLRRNCASKDKNIQSDQGLTTRKELEERIMLLEEEVSRLRFTMDTLKAENNNLGEAVDYLQSSCVCTPKCSHNGTVYKEGESWNIDECTVCVCQNDEAICQYRTDLEICRDLCHQEPCFHGGECYHDANSTDFNCTCQSPYSGRYCETWQNPCVWPPDCGSCDANLTRFYYDRHEQDCMPFSYTGCGGNINNFEQRDGCESVSMTGACCHREFSTAVEDLLAGNQNFETLCEVLTYSDCQFVHRQPSREEQGHISEVVGFYPSLPCDVVDCGLANGCIVGSTVYAVDEVARIGCDDCICQSTGNLVCKCSRMNIRREIRDMTREEISRFQHAVSELRATEFNNTWEQFRDIYMTHSMHSNGGIYFLPWNRVFLRQLEMKLQDIDCGITLPYFDFTTDVGNFAESVIWQPNYFGGDGKEDGCVPDHSFGVDFWSPCISRRFNASVQLPTQVELIMALNSEELSEVSSTLETYVAYVHNFIGGDMSTSASPYDPVFYVIHSFVDMMYWVWQNRGENKFKFPAAFGNVPMVPYSTIPMSVLDSEESLCVTYSMPSKGNPCNVTEIIITDKPDFPGLRGDTDPDSIYKHDGFNQFGYDIDGFDRRGFNPYGYDIFGYNRDHINRLGYNKDGFNRFGLDINGFDTKGFNILGRDRYGNNDTSNMYDETGYSLECLNRGGLNPNGFDKNGYDVEGRDKENCNYFINGPYAPIQSFRIMEILLKQSKEFLMSIPRTCPPVKMLPDSWYGQFWTTEIRDVTGLVRAIQPEEPVPLSTRRFCFDTSWFLTACPCDKPIARCELNPCDTTSCPAYPDAKCRVNFCGECKAEWYLNGRILDCGHERDFCRPNPCQHGGTCQPSKWSNESHLVTCHCPPGFDGHLCQYPALEVCSLPMNTGHFEREGVCNRQLRRWYFNSLTQSCEEFVYSGCVGNANNFQTIKECQAQCMIGACCYRRTLYPRRVIGFDAEGYDRYGFNIKGYNKLGEKQTRFNSVKTSDNRYSEAGYDSQGYNRRGFDKKGYNRYGYDMSGYDRDGYNLTGFSTYGEYDGIIDYDEDGYNAEGFNRAGYNCYGYNREGYDAYGTAAGFVYDCRTTTLSKCQSIESTSESVQIVTYSPGITCEEANCKEACECVYNAETYKLGETFKVGCQTCECTLNGVVECTCDKPIARKEVRDLTREELSRYQQAVTALQTSTGYPSVWFSFAELYSHYKPQAVGNNGFLPWHRYFLRSVERELQSIDCEITIPYYDWTVDAGQPEKSLIWANFMFGGNGDDTSSCVTHHPFKDYYPPYWSPCLRRQFNHNISVPDLIHIQYALNEKSYDMFRLQIEYLSLTFKQFVGGHMSSDLAPFDPLFYSHMAFIDKLWYDWQKKHEEGFINYPPTERYVPLAPFKAVPDDVLDSAWQMCVEYIPLSEGTLCNITQNVYGLDSEGYDHHGYDSEGFDRDGYNIYGVDSDGSPDSRGIYDKYGFDKYGYGRDRYDRSGFDKHGFYVDSYNLDGFDHEGYDRRGYDRYGFDRQGYSYFGQHRNGSLTPGVKEISVNIFDASGYNVHGLNRLGYDREGYDIFGFDARGYNRSNCNSLFLGPMYVVVKRFLEKEIDIDVDLKVNVVRRLCPDLTKFSKNVLRKQWFNRDNQAVEVIEILQRYGKQHPVGAVPAIDHGNNIVTTYSSEIDERLCVLTNFYSYCDIDEVQVLCTEDLCKGRTCPEYQDAVCRVKGCNVCKHEWYDVLTGGIVQCEGCLENNGQFRRENEEWKPSECEICTCQQGIVSCEDIVCPEKRCNNPAKIQGQCCPSCEAGCEADGRFYVPGSKFIAEDDACTSCSCEEGSIICDRIECDNIDNCHATTTFFGECCPVCLDCGKHANGSVWMETPCRQCRCIHAEVACEDIQCTPTDCDYPHTPDGECCPQCLSCYHKGKLYQDGEAFTHDSCSSCQCRHGSVECRSVSCPDVFCDKPIVPEGECCPVCDSECDYDERRYRHNEVFIASFNPCLNCSCMNSMVRCLSIPCPPLSSLPCENPIKRMGECCATRCPSCYDEGREYASGETWTPSDSPCRVCECRNGLKSCLPKTTCGLECTHGTKPKGSCCSPCTDCLFEDRVIGHGQSVMRGGKECQECTCHYGNIRCELVGTCPPVTCAVTEPVKGSCCVRCKSCAVDGRAYLHGETVTRDRCSRCTCREGQVVCEKLSCPQLRCTNPQQLPGECCPKCEECHFEGQARQDGERFQSRRDPCETCLCENGRVHCQSTKDSCPTPRCTHPANIAGQCCKRCTECEFMRRRIRNGQKFVPPGNDRCEICQCEHGNVTCGFHHNCPAVNCENPVVLPGACCPSCPDECETPGSEEEKKPIVDPTDKCKTCDCRDNHLNCQTKPCPDLGCSHPVRMPDECCATCDNCNYDRRMFKNGQSFPNHNDSCLRCVCEDGTVTCQPVVCPELNCRDVIQEPGRCCARCAPEVCTYNGQQYQEGRMFPSPVERCEDCMCRNGEVHCRRKQCTAVQCSHPAVKHGECCPSCNDCEYEGLVFRNREQFANQRNRCETCTCIDGVVSCDSKDCAPVTCQHPGKDDCCPSCTSCVWQSEQYRDGESFQDARNPCRTCTCRGGTVTCVEKDCTEVTCRNPVRNGCCDECNDCYYVGRRIQNGLEFMNPNNECQKCACQNGDIICDMMPCPPVTCSEPIPGKCCKTCPDCIYHNRRYREGQVLPSSTNLCEECICKGGEINCYKRPCPTPTCTNPVRGQCCPECSDCLHQDQAYPNRGLIPAEPGSCSECRCMDGNILCDPIRCPSVRCGNPVKDGCCNVCTDCMRNGLRYRNGETFSDGSPCRKCSCQDGSIECHEERCPPVTCLNPVQGRCCMECGGDCTYRKNTYKNREEFTRGCETCVCVDGSVQCLPKICAVVDCLHPDKENCCPVCGNCLYEGRRFKNGGRFPDLQDPCKECICQDGTVQCSAKECPPAKCISPTQGACCPRCEDCLQGNRTIPDGQRFQHINDECQECACQSGSVTCQRKPCGPANCENSVLDKCGCSACTDCNFHNVVYRNRAEFDHPTEQCQTCRCSYGRVVCQRKACTLSCTHPAKVTECCPICEDCFYEGKTYENNGDRFTSEADPCQRCACQDGNIMCQSITCQKPNCENPVKRAGECCLSCPVCEFLGRSYRDNEEFQHPQESCQSCVCQAGRVHCDKPKCEVKCTHPTSGACCPQCDRCWYEDDIYSNGEEFRPDACRTCTCKDGSVTCTSKTCPELKCLQRETRPGECCERCKGCNHWERGYVEDGLTWVLQSDPCIQCTCYGGLVTCMRKQCTAYCLDPITLPGQCCPVCPSCEYKNQVYDSGVEFSPTGDPCDMCVCENGRLRCERKSCPAAMTCPKDQLLDPLDGECCQTCSGFGTNCTSASFGQKIYPRPNDPCFECHCQDDFMWICTKRMCPSLNCPPKVQTAVPGQCCPLCPACYIETEDIYLEEGEEHIDIADPCVTCKCQGGDVKCKVKDCPAIECGPNELIYQPDGQCCQACRFAGSVDCMHRGLIRKAGESWTADTCTECTCIGGSVKCTSEKCSSIQCQDDEIPTISPGKCCPVCISKPGTCLVYGDPHYQSFDGVTLHFQGTCRYIMAADCEKEEFSVEVHHDNRGFTFDEVAWAQNFTFQIAGISVDLLQNHVVKINGREVPLPYFFEPHLYIELSGTTVLLNTNLGVMMTWNGESYAELSVPSKYKRRMCGLCGNFNGYPQDDLRTRGGQITNSEAVFGNSWKASTQVNSDCAAATDFDPCSHTGFINRKRAMAKCDVIMGKTFLRCHKVVPPQSFYSSCVYDMCACADNSQCLCEILSSYAHQCAKAGVKVQWRTASLCAISCSTELGFVFDDCGPACPRTCENMNTPLGNVTENCFKPCISSCQCTADKVQHNGQCIDPSLCPSFT